MKKRPIAAALTMNLMLGVFANTLASGYSPASATMVSNNQTFMTWFAGIRSDQGQVTRSTSNILAMNQPIDPAATPPADKYAGGIRNAAAAPQGGGGSVGHKSIEIEPSKSFLLNTSPNDFNWMQGGGG